MNTVSRIMHIRKSRRLAIAVLAIGAVVAGIGAAAGGSAVAAAASQAAPAAVARCTTAQLRAWLGVPGDGSAGHVAYPLELSNISARACTLYGYPGVSAVGAGGVQLGSAASRDAGAPERTVTLAPGATSYAGLQLTDTGVYPKSACDPKAAIGLRVYPPNTTVSQIVDYPFTACAKKGPGFLSVRVVVAGTGIPGWSV